MSSGPRARIDRFEIVRRLGQGLQGTVYLAQDTRLGRRVALKALVAARHDPIFARQLIEEARIAARVSHPNVIPVYEAIIHRGVPVLVFEFVEGRTLRQTLAERERYPEPEALSIVVRIAAGLKAAHEQGIVHLDLTPNNIMIDQEGRPRIMDFGLARLVSGSESQGRGETVTGTPRYLSPEHLSGASLGTASDVFALGLIAYELLTGRRAINQATIAEVLGAIARADIDWMPLHALRISPEVIALLRDALQRDPTRRTPNAIDLVAAIDAIKARQQGKSDSDLALQFLLRRIQRRPEFPAFSASIADINRMTADDSRAALAEISAVILRDFSLTNRVMKIANSAFFDRGEGRVTTISGAISRLGLRMLRLLSNGLLLFDQFGGRGGPLRDAMAASFIAGLIARALALRLGRPVEEAFICGLFHRLGANLLLYYLEDEAEEIRGHIARGMPTEQAERAVLATTSHALGMAVADIWRFPPAIIASMEPLPVRAMPALTPEVALRKLAGFSNDLAGLPARAGAAGAPLEQLQELRDRYQDVPVMMAADTLELLDAAAAEFRALAGDLGLDLARSDYFAAVDAFVAAGRIPDAEPATA